MMMMIIIGWGGIGGRCAAFVDRRPISDYRDISLPRSPPRSRSSPTRRRKSVRPFVVRTEITPLPPRHDPTTWLCAPSLTLGGGDDLSPSGQNRGYAPNFEIGSRGAEEDRELPRPFSTVCSSVRMTMTPDLLDFCTRTRGYGTIPPPREKATTTIGRRSSGWGGGGRATEDKIDT